MGASDANGGGAPPASTGERARSRGAPRGPVVRRVAAGAAYAAAATCVALATLGVLSATAPHGRVWTAVAIAVLVAILTTIALAVDAWLGLPARRMEREGRAVLAGEGPRLLIDPLTDEIVAANSEALRLYGQPTRAIRTLSMADLDTSRCPARRSGRPRCLAGRTLVATHRVSGGALVEIETRCSEAIVGGRPLCVLSLATRTPEPPGAAAPAPQVVDDLLASRRR